MIARDIVAAEILRQTEARSDAKSICPSEVARALAPGEAAWQSLLGLVRSVARDLARSGRIDVLRKGKPIDPAEEIRGVVRLRIRAPMTED